MLTALERLGLEVAAFTLLGSRAQAATLCALLDAEGRFVDWTVLAAARPWKAHPEESSSNVIKTRISLLRASMEDVGLGGLVISGGRKEGLIWALPEPGRSEVIARLIEQAGAV